MIDKANRDQGTASASGPTQKIPTHANTVLVHTGRDPSRQHGFVNPAIYRGSTIIYPTVDSFEARDQEFTYGRRGTPTVRSLETAVAELEGGGSAVITPSGLSAITTALLALVKSGDQILVTDSVYQPARRFCDIMLAPLGVETTYYDPCIGAGLKNLIRDNTRLVFTESPGSQTFEMQDIPAISTAAHERGVLVLLDNTWATPLYFDAFAHGVDVSIHSATKYFVGHADAMLGTITAKGETAAQIRDAYGNLGLCPGPEDVFLALRGLRTLAVRLRQHQESALEIARWLKARPEVDRVMHPALEDDPGHAIWKRDCTGSTGLFSAVLKPVSRQAFRAFFQPLKLFGIGASWGGFESLVIPFNPASYRTATKWRDTGPALRFHIGLDDVDDLKADLEAGFKNLYHSK